ncbi:hypothetical protein ILYODFUR_033340 [Ilyodon furcidens]|uniref:Uncharacterized protein n=1 Tax=Ilyodon furcidens TaxID=33524 RepID=A0ABV0T5Z7_9TELE
MLKSKLLQNNIRDVWSGMKKFTGFKQDNWTNGCLDRANELNTFLNRFSSETSSASSSPAHSQTDIPPSFDPQLSCHTTNVLAMNPSASTHLPSTKSEDADAAFASLFRLCLKKSGEETTGETELE